MLNILNRKENESMFESFSDLALCTLAVALLLVALLAISVSQRIAVRMQDNKFAKSVEIQPLHLACSKADLSLTMSGAFAADRLLYGSDPFVAVHLVRSESFWPPGSESGEGARKPAKELHLESRFNLSLYQFLMLAAGIRPEEHAAGKRCVILPVPVREDQKILYGPEGRIYGEHVSAKELLETVWPLIPVGTTGNAPRVYIESSSQQNPDGVDHSIVIGHCAYVLPEALEDGSLAWLSEFLSDSAEIVYLGDSWTAPESRTSKRIDFFERSGFKACAEAYRDYLFPLGLNDSTIGADKDLLSRIDPSDKNVLARLKWVECQKRVSEYVINGSLAEHAAEVFPPLLAFPEAWAAYVEDCLRKQESPPRWFYDEFLAPLGYNQMKIDFSEGSNVQ